MTERMGARGGAGADATGDSGDARPLSTGARPVVVVAGPTASGKSTLALDLARARGGVVVNADAMQCYADLRVLTARPGPADEAAAPHRLYGTEPAAGRMTAIRWREAALAEIAAAHAAGRLPILVGGSGLYLKALMEGLPAMPAVPDAVRSAVAARMAAEGPSALHGWLASRDPATAARLALGDRQRVARAVEVLEATGRPQSEWLAGPASPPPPGLRFVVAVLDPARDASTGPAVSVEYEAMGDGLTFSTPPLERETEITGPESMFAGPDHPTGDAVTFRTLNAYFTSIGGGTDQIQRNIVGERVLGLPKEPEPYKDTAFRDLPSGS